MPAGVSFAELIVESVLTCDVLIVLLAPGVDESDWVRREIDMARGAHVSILPLTIDFYDQVTLQRLEIADLQYATYRGPDDEQRLLDNIDYLARVTRDNQNAW